LVNRHELKETTPCERERLLRPRLDYADRPGLQGKGQFEFTGKIDKVRFDLKKEEPRSRRLLRRR
jgi:hypothetical protein